MYGDCRACYRIKRYEQMLSKGSRTVLRLHLFYKIVAFCLYHNGLYPLD